MGDMICMRGFASLTIPEYVSSVLSAFVKAIFSCTYDTYGISTEGTTVPYALFQYWSFGGVKELKNRTRWRCTMAKSRARTCRVSLDLVVAEINHIFEHVNFFDKGNISFSERILLQLLAIQKRMVPVEYGHSHISHKLEYCLIYRIFFAEFYIETLENLR